LTADVALPCYGITLIESTHIFRLAFRALDVTAGEIGQANVLKVGTGTADVCQKVKNSVLRHAGHPLGRRVKKPECLPSSGLMDLPLPALGLDFPRAMPHTHAQKKP
jgi:hypothetical protein